MTIAPPVVNPAKEYMTVPLPSDEVFDPVPDDPEHPVEEESTIVQGVQWKPVCHYPGVAPNMYEVSNRGVVRGPSGTKLKPNSQGQYMWVALRTTDGLNQGRTTSARVDKLVLTEFDHWEPLMSPEHKDGNTFNNQASNLAWREPSKTEFGALKAQEERRQGIRPRVNTRKKEAPVPPPPKQAVSVIQMTRKYVFEDVSIEVGEEGGLLQVHPDPNKVRYSPHQTVVLCQLMARLHEMNTVMGVY